MLQLCFLSFGFAQDTLSYKKVRVGYDLKIGRYTNEYTAVSPAATLHYVAHPNLWFGIRAGLNHLFETAMTGQGSLRDENLFLKREIKFAASTSARYYFNQRKISPLLEGRLGISRGEVTQRTDLTMGGSLGMAFRFPYGGIFHIGYYTDLLAYHSNAYRTDGTGHSVYRIINNHPIKRWSHGGFLNFTFN